MKIDESKYGWEILDMEEWKWMKVNMVGKYWIWRKKMDESKYGWERLDMEKW